MEDAKYGSIMKNDGAKMRIMGMCDSKKKRKTAGIRSTTTPQLPAHLILHNILTRLPAKSLFRFCCVSKLWDATIDGGEDPQFVSSHLNHGKQNRPLLLCLVHEVDEDMEKHKHRRSSYNFISIPPKFDDPKFFYDCPKLRLCDDYFKFWSIFPGETAIVGECRGLFCIRSKDNPNGPLEIHNLTTREALLLPRPHHLPLAPKEYLSYGFGFDDSNKQFKIVQLVVGKRCMVYTFGTSNSSWRDVTLTSNLLSPFFNNRRCCFLHRALYSNTALHWFLRFSDTTMILSFDIHHEQFLLIPGPPHYPKNLQPKTKPKPEPTNLFFEFRGCLCVGSQEKGAKSAIDIRLFYLKNDPRHHHHPHLPFHPHWEELTMTLPSAGYFEDKVWVTSFLGEPIFLWYLATFNPLAFLRFKCHAHLEKSFGLSFHKQIPKSIKIEELFFVYHVENLLSLKTLLPPSPAAGPGAAQVKYSKYGF